MNLEHPIRIFSDLHLAHPATRIVDVETFRLLIHGARTVIFNGDTFEQRNNKLRAQGEKQVDELKNLCDDCGAEAIFLTGNHDPTISGPHFLDLFDGTVFVTHGDALFPTISPWNPKVWPLESEMKKIHAENGANPNLEQEMEATSRCREMVEAVDKPRMRGRLWKLKAAFRAVWPPKRFIEMMRCWMVTPTRAQEFIERHRSESRFFIFGHTHRPFIKCRSQRVLVNTGGFLSFGKAQFVEMTDESISVYRIDESETNLKIGKEVYSALKAPATEL